MVDLVSYYNQSWGVDIVGSWSKKIYLVSQKFIMSQKPSN